LRGLRGLEDNLQWVIKEPRCPKLEEFSVVDKKKQKENSVALKAYVQEQ